MGLFRARSCFIGRQIFQLCVGTLLVGIDLAHRADLQEKFVSNNERYQKICDFLRSETGTPAEKFVALEPTLRVLRRYQFVPSGELTRGTLASAVRYAASALIATGEHFEQDLADALAKANASKREDGKSMQLATIKDLVEAFKATEPSNLSPEARIACDLIEIAWMRLFEIYYWLKDRNQSDA